MQKVISLFVSDFRKEIINNRHKKSILSAILLGSAAKGEFVAGESDIDMIVIVKKSQDKKTCFFLYQKHTKETEQEAWFEASGVLQHREEI